MWRNHIKSYLPPATRTTWRPMHEGHSTSSWLLNDETQRQIIYDAVQLTTGRNNRTAAWRNILPSTSVEVTASITSFGYRAVRIEFLLSEYSVDYVIIQIYWSLLPRVQNATVCMVFELSAGQHIIPSYCTNTDFQLAAGCRLCSISCAFDFPQKVSKVSILWQSHSGLMTLWSWLWLWGHILWPSLEIWIRDRWFADR